MTKLTPRDEAPATPRKAMTRARRLRILAHHNHQCAYPGCTMSQALEIDHVLPLEIGGSDEDHNLQPLCGYHHRKKTAQDIKLIAKARRLRKATLTERKASTIKSRGFDKTKSRGFDGQVRERSQ